MRQVGLVGSSTIAEVFTVTQDLSSFGSSAVGWYYYRLWLCRRRDWLVLLKTPQHMAVYATCDIGYGAV
ncbi:MAG: hypothetical protein GX358_00190 [candidate division WS1 bacterium]|nr:hypothetical protein [candidate division WS1 bacterium]